MTTLTSAPIKEQLLHWCKQEHLLIDDVADAKARFRLKLRPPGRSVSPAESDVLHVHQPLDSDDRVVVSAGIAFDQSFAAPMRAVPNRDDIVLALEAALDGLTESYVVDYSDGFLRSFVVYDEIFADGLTKDRFIRALRSVHRGLLVALWTLRPMIEAAGGDIDARLGLPEEDQPTHVGAATGSSAADGQRQASDCARCGAALPAGVRFCGACGAAVAQAPPRPSFCRACGGELRAGAQYCPHCGAAI